MCVCVYIKKNIVHSQTHLEIAPSAVIGISLFTELLTILTKSWEYPIQKSISK